MSSFVLPSLLLATSSPRGSWNSEPLLLISQPASCSATQSPPVGSFPGSFLVFVLCDISMAGDCPSFWLLGFLSAVFLHPSAPYHFVSKIPLCPQQFNVDISQVPFSSSSLCFPWAIWYIPTCSPAQITSLWPRPMHPVVAWRCSLDCPTSLRFWTCTKLTAFHRGPLLL